MKKRLFLFSLASLLLCGAIYAQDQNSAKDLYLSYEKPRQQAAGKKPRRTGRPGAKVRIELMRAGESQSHFVPVNTTFQKGDKVKFHFAVNFPAHVAITNLGSTGKFSMLFPYGGSDIIVDKTRDYTVPEQKDLWFEFDGKSGDENLTFIFSRVRFVNTTQTASSTSGEIIVNPTTSAVDQQALSDLNSRALSRGKDLNLVQVSNNGNNECYILTDEESLSQPIGFTVRLKHK